MWLWTFQSFVCLFCYFLSLSRCPTPVKNMLIFFLLHVTIMQHIKREQEQRESRIKATWAERKKKCGVSNPRLAELQQMTSGFVCRKVDRRMRWKDASIHSPPPPNHKYGVSEHQKTQKLGSCPSQIWYASKYSHTSSKPLPPKPATSVDREHKDQRTHCDHGS